MFAISFEKKIVGRDADALSQITKKHRPKKKKYGEHI